MNDTEDHFHLRAYGDVSKEEFDYYFVHRTLDGFPYSDAAQLRALREAFDRAAPLRDARRPQGVHPAPSEEKK